MYEAYSSDVGSLSAVSRSNVAFHVEGLYFIYESDFDENGHFEEPYI